MSLQHLFCLHISYSLHIKVTIDILGLSGVSSKCPTSIPSSSEFMPLYQGMSFITSSDPFPFTYFYLFFYFFIFFIFIYIFLFDFIIFNFSSCLMWLVHNNLLEQQSNVLPIPSLSEINKILVISNTLSITYTEYYTYNHHGYT